MRKTNIAIILIMILVVSLLPNIVFADDNRLLIPDYSWYGDGEKKNYEISSEEQLLGFANIVNGKAEDIKKDTFKNKNVYLTKNLDLTGIMWTPIGSSMYDHSPDSLDTKMFEGTFDGKYHTINGLSSNNYKASAEDISSGEHSYGLFGYAYGATIKNLSLTNVLIKCSGEAGADGAGVAAVIGYYVPKDNSPSAIENVHVLSGTIQATNNMGGIIGYMEVKGENVNIDISITNSTNAANVATDAREAGGILGLFQNADGDIGSLKFINCINYGDITANSGASSTAAGGIIGKEQSYSNKKYQFKVYFEKCRNSGNITAIGRTGSNTETHAAGIGTVYYHYGAPIIVNNCVNTGNITITGSSTTNFIDGIIAHPAIGEINEIDAIIQNTSYNVGIITTPKSNTIVIKYDINGAQGNEKSVRVNSGSNITLPTGSNLSRDGYIFAGWNTKIDGTGTSYLGGTSVNFDLSTTLYAQWKKEKEKWYVSSINPQIYTGNPIKPTILVYDDNNNVIDSSKYIITYQKDSECINVGKHIVKITYNNETIELDYEIIKARPEIKITPSSNEVKGNKEVELVITGTKSDNIQLLCDDSEVIIKNNNNNTFTAIIPNKDKEYLFTVIYKEDENHFEGSASTIVTGIKTDEIENPDTSDYIYKTFIFLIISMIAMPIFILLRKYKKI